MVRVRRYLSCALYGTPTALALSPDGRQLAAGTEEGVVALWDLASARRLAASPPATCHVGPVWSLSYSQGDGAVLASGGADETVRLWRNEQGEVTAAAEASGGAAVVGTDAGAGVAPYGMIGCYRTKSSPVVSLQFTGRNLLMAAGPFHKRGPLVAGGS